MHIGRNNDRKTRHFSLEHLCVPIKHGQYSPEVIHLTSESSSDGKLIILIETLGYLAHSHRINAGRLP